MDIYALDGEGSTDPFAVVSAGNHLSIPPPTQLAAQDVVAISESVYGFGELLVPDMRVPLWKLRRLAEAYRKHYGLLSGEVVRRLVWLLSRYGAAIERDLAHDGIDLAQCWRSRRWRKLLNLIDGLDESSALQEALAQDDEIAAGYIGDDSAPTQYRPRASDWTAQTRLFAAMHDRLGEVVQGLIAMSGNKPPKLDPWPRPEIAATRAQRKARESNYEELLADIAQAHARYETTL